MNSTHVKLKNTLPIVYLPILLFGFKLLRGKEFGLKCSPNNSTFV